MVLRKEKGKHYINGRNTYRHSLKTGGKCSASKQWSSLDKFNSLLLFFSIFQIFIIKVYLLL